MADGTEVAENPWARTPACALTKRPSSDAPEGKKKAITLVGSPSCLLTGVTILCYLLHLIHIVPRTLWNSHKSLFILLQRDIGVVVRSADGTTYRVLNLDSSRNMEIMNILFHKLFDAISVLKGLGSGVLYIISEELDKCLKIIREGRKKKLDHRQMFPDLCYRYLANVFSGYPPIRVDRVGPPQRTYAHLDMGQASNAELLAGDDVNSPEDTEYEDEAEALKSQQIDLEDVPDGYDTVPAGANTESSHMLPRDGPIAIVSHGGPVFFIWDATYKLWVRHLEEVMVVEAERQNAKAGEGKQVVIRRKYPPLCAYEVTLFGKLWDTCWPWFIPRTTQDKKRIDQQVERETFEGPVRKSARLAGIQSALEAAASPMGPPKPRKALTDMPAPEHPQAALSASGSRSRKPSLRAIEAAPPEPGPRTRKPSLKAIEAAHSASVARSRKLSLKANGAPPSEKRSAPPTHPDAPKAKKKRIDTQLRDSSIRSEPAHRHGSHQVHDSSSRSVTLPNRLSAFLQPVAHCWSAWSSRSRPQWSLLFMLRVFMRSGFLHPVVQYMCK
ncbi:hypothetical protein FB107DRAFT_269291 [Schizophyllum commune]